MRKAAALSVVGLGLLGAVGLFGIARRDTTSVYSVHFEARVDGTPLRCESSSEAGGFELRDLRFFVHDVRLVDAAGREVRAELIGDGETSDGVVALLDFENGRGSCAGGSIAMNTELRFRAEPGDYRGLRFRLGVPFEPNHGDPATASAPLEAGTMHWGWRGGYEFVRFEAARGDRSFRLHLGSTGCEGRFGAIPRCAHPNRPSIELDRFEDGGVLVLDLAPSLPDDGDALCMSAPDDAGCRSYFDALGLSRSDASTANSTELFTWGSDASQQARR